jgi:ABC-type transport system involved in multi-copper enzyme maturation permease subunit
MLVSLRRLVMSRQSLVCLLLLSLGAVAVAAWSHRHDRTAAEFIEEILVTVYLSFLLPIFCLSFASSGIASDREEQTLVYLLSTPLPRPVLFLAKAAAALVASLGWTMLSLLVLCFLAGTPGRTALLAIWPAILAATITYVGLFQLFSVLFRRATIIALGYAIFLETLVGNMPGIVKRLTICFYARCMVFAEASDLGVGPTGPFNEILFQPLPSSTAQTLLYAATAAMLILSAIVFARREY